MWGAGGRRLTEGTYGSPTGDQVSCSVSREHRFSLGWRGWLALSPPSNRRLLHPANPNQVDLAEIRTADAVAGLRQGHVLRCGVQVANSPKRGKGAEFQTGQ